MKNGDSNLPSGWEKVELGDIIIRIEAGKSPKTQGRPAEDNEFGVLKVSAVSWGEFRDKENKALLPEQLIDFFYTVKAGDLLISRANTVDLVGSVVLVDEDHPNLFLSDKTLRLVPATQEKVLRRFLLYALRTKAVRGHFEERATGTSDSMRNISQVKIRSAPILLPPLNEQRRIVAKIEDLTAHSRKAREALDEVPKLIDQFRQSVLAAAFRGDLTADWRSQHPDVEPASELLERIRVERRDRWEKAELERQNIGNEGTFKKKLRGYSEPVEAKSEHSPKLPTSWCWATLDELTYFTVDYRGRTPKKADHGIPLVSSAAVKHDEIRIGPSGFVSHETYQQWITRGLPEAGDLIITTEAPVGEAALFPNDQTYLLSRRVFACKTNGINNRFLMHSLYSEAAKQHFKDHNRGSTVPRILKPDLLSVPIPLPSLAEQEEIIRRIDSALQSINQNIFSLLSENQVALQQLDQSILAKAFRGQLVPQDPNDEPASVLLDRIRAEREKLTPKKKKRTPRKKQATQLPIQGLNP